MADIRFKALSVVVVGKEHNPTILHPHFLQHNGIVSEGMDLQEGGVITTPAFSQVPYQDGLNIQLTPQRVEFAEQLDGDKGCEGRARVPEMAKRYLRKVPLVHYTAVGINWSASVGTPGGELSTVSLIRQGAWLHMEEKVPSISMTLTYQLDKGRVIRAIIQPDPGKEGDGGVLLRGNSHYPIGTANESHETAVGILDGWESSLEDFRKLANNIARGPSE